MMFRSSTGCVFLLSAALLCVVLLGSAFAQQATFVGSKACADCHEQEYENFSKFAKKAHSADSVKIMAGDLTDEELKECFVCHATGYGQPGGFVSFEATPDLADAGCEVCHGPGSQHIGEGGDPDYIKGKLELKDCEVCHNEERVSTFDFKPLLYGGAH